MRWDRLPELPLQGEDPGEGKACFVKAVSAIVLPLVFTFVLSFTLVRSAAPPSQRKALFCTYAGMVPCSHLVSDCHQLLCFRSVGSDCCPMLLPPRPIVFTSSLVGGCVCRLARYLEGIGSMGLLGGVGEGTESACKVLQLTTCVFESQSFHVFVFFRFVSHGEGLGSACSMRTGRREGSMRERIKEPGVGHVVLIWGAACRDVSLASLYSSLHRQRKHPSDY